MLSSVNIDDVVNTTEQDVGAIEKDGIVEGTDVRVEGRDELEADTECPEGDVEHKVVIEEEHKLDVKEEDEQVVDVDVEVDEGKDEATVLQKSGLQLW